MTMIGHTLAGVGIRVHSLAFDSYQRIVCKASRLEPYRSAPCARGKAYKPGVSSLAGPSRVRAGEQAVSAALGR